MRANLLQGNALSIPLADESVQCVVTSPPYYGLRDYNADGQLGLEQTLAEYIENMVAVFAEVHRVLRPDGVVFLNMGDSYANTGVSDPSKVGGFTGDRIRRGAKGTMDSRPRSIPEGMKPKDLMMVPHRLAIALQEWGWWVRSDVVWHKPNPMPESVTDRPTKAHEYIFLLTKNARYFYDADAVREEHSNPKWIEGALSGRWIRKTDAKTDASRNDSDSRSAGKSYAETINPAGRNRRSVWTITTKPYSGAHFATFPPEIPEICIKAGTSERGQCPECGAPWERVTESTPNKPRVRKPIGKGHAYYSSISGPQQQNEGGNDLGVQIKQLGWRPTCEHEAEPVPQIVLDPFNGSGTTVMVAQQLGRIGVGNDLSWEYLQLARERTGLAQVDAWLNGKEAVEANLSGLPLFT